MNIFKCLEFHIHGYYRFMFGDQNMSDKESYQRGLAFLERYGLLDDDYSQECIPVMEKIFKLTDKDYFSFERQSTTDLFRQEFLLAAYFASHIFDEHSIRAIQSICKSFNEEFIYIIESEKCVSDADLAVKLKIPVDTKWEDLMDGGCISDMLFASNNAFYIFGDSCQWGKWCDYDNSWSDYEIFGFKDYNKEVDHFIKEEGVSKNESDHIGTIPEALQQCFKNTVFKDRFWTNQVTESGSP